MAERGMDIDDADKN
jgi:hypothetical protein